MYKYIVLCLCVSFCGVLCDLNKEEGAACEWDGVKGKCVKKTQCLTTLEKYGDPHPICSIKGDVTIVCCTDCELVNDTRNFVMCPTSGYYWKDGTKARDSCLEYLDTLPYRCRNEGFYSGISKSYDEEKKCHSIDFWGIGGLKAPGYEPGAAYPHQALLGYGEDLASLNWLAGGSIISNKYILTAAHVGFTKGPPKFVAVGVKKRSDGSNTWQTHTVKRVIRHPEYRNPAVYNDIALIELDDTITFNKNVLPACLHVEAADDESAITTSWRDLNPNSRQFANSVQTINLVKFTEEECKTAHPPARNLVDGIDYKTQMCYGTKSQDPYACKGQSGVPLLISTQFSHCVYAIIGVTSFGQLPCAGIRPIPDVFTRVAHYIPWIESVVWAE